MKSVKNKEISDYIVRIINYDKLYNNYSLTEITKDILYLNLCTFTGKIKSLTLNLKYKSKKLLSDFDVWYNEIKQLDKLECQQFLEKLN